MIPLHVRQEFDKAFSPELEDIVYWISQNLDPDDVFEEDRLDEWAQNNGWQK